MKRNVLCVVVFSAAVAACGESGDAYYRPISQADYPQPNSALGEKLGGSEIESTARIAAIIEAHLRRLYADGQIYRDAHAKADGCVDAKFSVGSGLGAPFNQGLFAAARTYDAVIRFSNSNEDPRRSDAKPDGRGMAIKIYDPPGRPISQDPAGRASQDFVMISHPTFLVADPGDYRKLIGYVDSGNEVTKLLSPVLSLLSLGWMGTKNAIATTSLKIDNPLNTRYWSMVPYQLGTGASAVAVKYSAAPCVAGAVNVPVTTDSDYLRHAMAASLAQGTGACMKFMVQPRMSAAMSVEDSRVEWPESQAPFTQVATISIPAQTFDTKQRNDACELLSYSPWHALPDHKPLGAVNRMRKVIYERISAIRRASSPPAPAPQ